VSDFCSRHDSLPGYTIELNLRNRLVVIVGAGQVTRRKLPDLFASGARVLLIDPAPAPGLPQNSALRLQQRAYCETDLEGAWLVFAATADSQTNSRVASDAEARHIPCCRVDSAVASSFISPARLQRAPLSFSVSSRGGNPALAAVFRDRLNDLIPQEWQTAALLLGKIRQKLLTEKLQATYNQQVLLQLLDAGLLEQIARRNRGGIDQLLEKYFGAGFSLESLQFSFPEGTS